MDTDNDFFLQKHFPDAAEGQKKRENGDRIIG